MLRKLLTKLSMTRSKLDSTLLRKLSKIKLKLTRNTEPSTLSLSSNSMSQAKPMPRRLPTKKSTLRSKQDSRKLRKLSLIKSKPTRFSDQNMLLPCEIAKFNKHI